MPNKIVGSLGRFIYLLYIYQCHYPVSGPDEEGEEELGGRLFDLS